MDAVPWVERELPTYLFSAFETPVSRILSIKLENYLFLRDWASQIMDLTVTFRQKY